MKAIEFLKQNRVYEDETIYNSVGEIVGTVSQLMEEYAALRQPPVSGELPPSQIGDKEYKKLMKAIYPKDRSKKFRR